MYKLEDMSFGDASADNPLESLTWQDLRNEIYGEPRLTHLHATQEIDLAQRQAQHPENVIGCGGVKVKIR